MAKGPEAALAGEPLCKSARAVGAPHPLGKGQRRHTHHPTPTPRNQQPLPPLLLLPLSPLSFLGFRSFRGCPGVPAPCCGCPFFRTGCEGDTMGEGRLGRVPRWGSVALRLPPLSVSLWLPSLPWLPPACPRRQPGTGLDEKRGSEWLSVPERGSLRIRRGSLFLSVALSMGRRSSEQGNDGSAVAQSKER